MGACSCGGHVTHTDDAGSVPIQVRPAAAAGDQQTKPSHIGTDIKVIPTAPASPEHAALHSPLPLSVGAHPFGSRLTPAELRALFPAYDTHNPTSHQEEQIWTQEIMTDPNAYRNKDPHAWNKRIIDQAIPEQHRVKLWSLALKIDQIETPKSYDDYLLVASPADSQISRDIYRTFSDHPFFSHKPVQRCIGRILHAWSIFNPIVSYVQGHNCLAALFLMVTLDEEAAFRCFLGFLAHPQHGMQAFYSDGLQLLLDECRYLDALLSNRMPQLTSHFQHHHLDALTYATPFYLTAFTHHLPLESCIFVFDFLLMGDFHAAPALSSSSSVAGVVRPPAGATSRIATAITRLAIALLEEQQAALLQLSQVEQLFRTVQQLYVLREKKSRTAVFKRAIEATTK